MMIIVKNKQKLKFMLELYLWLFILTYLVADITVLLGLKVNGDYIFGTKFAIAYLHIRAIAIIIIYIKNWNVRNVLLIAALFVESIAINLVTGCATGLVGTVLFFLCLYLYFRKIGIIQNPFVQVSTLLVCALFPFWYEWLLNNSFVQFIVEEVLHRKLTLTGRTIIYSKLPLIMGDNALIGYGINTNTEICFRWGAINVQNGMLKVLMESGIIGALAVFVLYFAVFWRIRKSKGMVVIAVASYLFTISVLSAIEITINTTTLVILLYLSIVTEKEKEVS
jgi:hypothetical protein